MVTINQFEEIQKSVQSTAHHLYGENGGIQALSRADLLVQIETMAQQIATMQEQLQDYNQMLHQVSQQQQDTDEQAEKLAQMLQASGQLLNQQPNQPTPLIATSANPPANPLQAVQQGHRSLQQQVPGGQEGSQMRLDSVRAPALFTGTQQKDVDAWIVQMKLYFATNPLIADHWKAIRIALNLSGAAQKWFYHIQKNNQLIERMPLKGLLVEFRAVFTIPNRVQTARRQLRQARHLSSVDTYVQLFRTAYYQCDDVSHAKAKDRFIENLKQKTRLYVEERQPVSLDHAITLAHSHDAMRHRHNERNNSQRGRNSGYRGGRGRYNNDHRGGHFAGNGRQHNNGYRGRNNGQNGQNGRGRGRRATLTCYRCGQLGHLAPDCTVNTVQQQPNSPSKN